MVDFGKQLSKKMVQKPVNPLDIYNTLDRASDKGPLRPAQSAILEDWNNNHRAKRDVIIKLHTGQGKTLIGLLILQSRLNEGKGPALYLCPNNFLVNQTYNQAKQFGIDCCIAPDELPEEFLDGKRILITSIQKLFNGLTKFSIGVQSIHVSSLLMDDSHACIDAIKESMLIRLQSRHPAYPEIRDLFKPALQNQGMGTYADIENGNPNALPPIPYWEWHDKIAEITRILSSHSRTDEIKFAWPLLKDTLVNCQCIISGDSLEIVPYLAPLPTFGTYYYADYRIFMSATVANDAFLVKGLGLDATTISSPLIYEDERWSGEKMVIIPSLIDRSLDRSKMVVTFGKPMPTRSFGGVAVLSPSFGLTKDWEAAGALIARKESIGTIISDLVRGEFGKTVVIVNRYDGIDLPDSACRILVMDSKPNKESLLDRYVDSCRSSSEVTAIKTARTVEQGLGRSVRGEKDFCAILIIGADLVRFIRSKDSRKFLSDQTRTQIEIGLEITQMAKDEISEGKQPSQAFTGLLKQCLGRDEDWKAYYRQQMDATTTNPVDTSILTVFQKELKAEEHVLNGDILKAVETIQNLIDTHPMDEFDKGWYLQEMARFKYAASRHESNVTQKSAHRKNHLLLRPVNGMTISRLKVVNFRRMERINNWVREFESYQELSIALDDILSNLSFGVMADRFENALNQLANALGFQGERPDKEWKEGPDNLWFLRDNEYLLFECKNEVLLSRKEINEHETEQMNRSVAWFSRYYPNAKCTNTMIIPATKLAKDAAILPNVNMRVLDEQGLKTLTYGIRHFFAEFSELDFRSLSESGTQVLVNQHNLSVEAITDSYTKPLRQHAAK